MVMVKKKLKRFEAGMFIQPDGTAIPNNACIELINMRLSDKGYPTVRFGSKLITSDTTWDSADLSASKCRGIFVNGSAATDAKAYIYVACGTFLFYSTGGNFTKLAISGTDIVATETAEWDAIFWNGTGYFVNGQYPIHTSPTAATSTAIKVDGTTCTSQLYVDANSWQKNIQFLAQYGRRVYAALSTSSVVYTSVVGDPEDWYDGTNNLYSYFGYEDGEDITGLHPTRDGILITKPTNVYTWHCVGAFTNWRQVHVTGKNPRYGCLWHKSIQPYTYRDIPGWAWLGSVGVVHFDGRDCREISGPIRSAIQGLNQTKSTKSAWTIDDKTEWDGGIDGVNMVDTYGSQLKPLAQHSKEDWAAGTDSGTEDVYGAVIDEELQTKERYLRPEYIVDDFRNGVDDWTAKAATTWGVDDSNYSARPVTGSGTSYMSIAQAGNSGFWGVKLKVGASLCVVTSAGTGYAFKAQLSGVSAYKRVTHTSSTSKLNTFSYDGTFADNDYHTLSVHRNNSTNLWTIYIDGVSYETFTSSTYTTFGYVELEVSVTAASYGVGFKRPFYHATDPTPTGNFTSQTIDYGEAPNAISEYGNLVAQEDTGDGGAWTYTTQASADDSSWDAAVAVGAAGENGGAIGSAVKRYLRWIATYTTTSHGDNPRINSVNVGARYVSSNKDLGATPSSLGLFKVTQDVPDSAEVQYYIKTAATEGGLDGTGWVRIWENEIPSLVTHFSSSEDWVRFKIVMSMQAYDEVPTVDGFTFEYYVGTAVGTPAAKTIKGVYHLAVDEGSGNNDAVYVINESGAWSKDTNLNINGWAVFKDKVVTASSAAGNVSWMYQGTNDDGKLIPFKLVTQDDYVKGSEESYEDMQKCFRKIYPVAKGAAYKISSKVGGQPWKEVPQLDASDITRTQKRDLPGMNTGQYIRYKIEPFFYDFSENPDWPDLNGKAFAYWHEDEYIHFDATDEATFRRYYKPLGVNLTQDDEFGFWAKIYPTTLDADGHLFIGFCDTNSPDFSESAIYNFVGGYYIHGATTNKGLSASFWDDAGTWTKTFDETALTADTVHYIGFRFKDGVGSITTYDTNRDVLTGPTTFAAGTKTFNINAFCLANLPSAGAEQIVIQMQECVPFFVPTEYTGFGGGEFEFQGMSHEFVPMKRIQR